MCRARDEAEQQVWVTIPHITNREQGISDWKAQKLLNLRLWRSRASAFYAPILPSRPILCGTAHDPQLADAHTSHFIGKRFIR
jgi:hypothetical protein